MQYFGTPVEQVYKNILDITRSTDEVETVTNKLIVDRYNQLKESDNQPKLEKFLSKHPEAPELTSTPVTKHTDRIRQDLEKIQKLDSEHKIFEKIADLEDEQIKKFIEKQDSFAVGLTLVYSQEMQNFKELDIPTLEMPRVTLPMIKLVDRTIRFFKQVRPIVSAHLELNARKTDVRKPISIIFRETGFITNDTMWDIEFSDNPNTRSTKDMLIRYIITKNAMTRMSGEILNILAFMHPSRIKHIE